MTPQERARLGGLARAVSLWKQGRGMRHYPPELRDLARRAMVHRVEGELQRERSLRFIGPVPGDGSVCGAVTRSGAPCMSFPVRGMHRCRMHGGASTGPTTDGGKALALEALARGRATVAARRAR